MSERVTLSDTVGIVAVDGSERDDTGHVTTVNGGVLADAVDILDTLGWSTVDIGTIEADGGQSALVLEPAGDPLFVDSNAGIVIAPRNDGRNGDIEDGDGE